MDYLKDFTRRKFIVAATSVAAAAMMKPTLLGAAAIESKKKHPRVSDYVSVLSPKDSGYAEKLESLFPNLSASPDFAAIASHAVIVTNVSDRPIRAHTTRWKIATAKGTYKGTLLHYFHPQGKHPNRVHFGMSGNKTRFSGKIPMLKPGASRLVTPYFNWSSRYYLTNDAPYWQQLVQGTASRRRLYKKLAAANSVQVTVDAVVLNRKHVVGRDRHRLGDVYRKTRNAEHDEALAVLNLIKGGASLESVQEVLREHASKSIANEAKSDTKQKPIYDLVRKRQAKVLLRRLKQAIARNKTEEFTKTVTYLAKQRKTVTGLKAASSTTAKQSAVSQGVPA